MKKDYVAPAFEVWCALAEEGFATSINGASNENYNYQKYQWSSEE